MNFIIPYTFLFRITNVAIILSCLKILAHNRIQWLRFKRLCAVFPLYMFDVLYLTFMEEEASMQSLH